MCVFSSATFERHILSEEVKPEEDSLNILKSSYWSAQENIL